MDEQNRSIETLRDLEFMLGDYHAVRVVGWARDSTYYAVRLNMKSSRDVTRSMTNLIIRAVYSKSLHRPERRAHSTHAALSYPNTLAIDNRILFLTEQSLS